MVLRLSGSGNYQVGIIGNCQECGQPAARRAALPAARRLFPAILGQIKDPQEVASYDKMLRETDFNKQRALMRLYEKRVLDGQVHEAFLLWWYRVAPDSSYVKGWKIGPSHYLNQDLATIWLDQK